MSDPRPLNLPKADPAEAKSWIESVDGGSPKPPAPQGQADGQAPAQSGGVRSFIEGTPHISVDGQPLDTPSAHKPMSFEGHVANHNAELAQNILQQEVVVQAIADARSEAEQQVAALQAQLQQAHAQMQQLQQDFASTAAETAALRSATLSEAEGQMLDLAVAVAGAIVEHEVEENPSLHAGLAAAALESLGDSGRATLRAAPAAHAHIVEGLGGEEVEVHGVQVRIVKDPQLAGLGCIVETEAGRVDGRLSERLRMVRRAFEDEQRRKYGGGEAS